MAYTSSGRLPIERASKIGHVKIIQEPHIQRLIEAFESIEDGPDENLGELSGTLDLSRTGEIENVIAIDGSHAAIPNSIKNHKRIAFIRAGAQVVSRTSIAAMKMNPVVDPRDLARQLQGSSKSVVAALPLGGVAIPGETVVETIRRSVNNSLKYWRLYDTLRFLISREWLPTYDMQEHMDCMSCGRDFRLPRSTLRFQCPHCQYPHMLSDYLGIAQGPPDDWAKEEAAISFRSVLETLLLMEFLRLYRDRPVVLKRTLFVKDGPLLLRAYLSRLVEPIRAFLEYLHDMERTFHIVGVEKTGDLVEHLPLIANVLKKPGDFFLPSVRYLHERIQGVPFVEETYRNRVQYGAKIVVRIGADHVVVLNVPTGEFLTNPDIEQLYGLPESVAVLSEMKSYSYENALIPLVLVNSSESISMNFSNEVLENFARRLLSE
jgi:hypothetical protein